MGSRGEGIEYLHEASGDERIPVSEDAGVSFNSCPCHEALKRLR